MKTKEIGGVLYKLVPEEKEKSCHGCIFKDPDGDFCRIITGVCKKGLIYKKADEPISDSHLKPFNLEAAKAGKPVCTRTGRRARIVCFDSTLKDYPLVVLLEENEEEHPYTYTDKGKFNKAIEEGSLDLMMLPEKKEGYINVYKTYYDYDVSKLYFSKEEAEKAKEADCIATVKIEWEES